MTPFLSGITSKIVERSIKIFTKSDTLTKVRCPEKGREGFDTRVSFLSFPVSSLLRGSDKDPYTTEENPSCQMSLGHD